MLLHHCFEGSARIRSQLGQREALQLVEAALLYRFRAVNTIERATARWRSGVRSLRMRSMSCGVKSG